MKLSIALMVQRHAERITYGHRSLHPDPITLASADVDAYIQKLQEVDVIVCPKHRRDTIEKQVRTVLDSEGCLPIMDEELLDTVNYLVENPHPIVGNFSESHLQLPPEVLITAMKKHQRYFRCGKMNRACFQIHHHLQRYRWQY